MNLLLIHLSDLHIKSASDPILSRPTLIANAVTSLTQDVDTIFIATSGDIAYSGKEQEYLLAATFYASLQSSIASNLSPRVVPVHLVTAPGNHDCDFQAKPDFVRKSLVEAILSNPKYINDAETVSECVSVQAPFFSFLKTLSSPNLHIDATTSHAQLHYTYNVPFDEGMVSFHCYNTAWISQKRERLQSSFHASRIGSRTHRHFPSEYCCIPPSLPVALPGVSTSLPKGH